MKKENIEAIVPLLPMQQSFLWHSLRVDSASSLLQLRCTLRGDISINQLRLAWAQVVQKHQALRSSVHWESVNKPVQVVHKQVNSDITLIKYPTARGNDEGLTQYLERDRNEKLDLTKAPAYRIALCQTDDNTYELIWSLSHVLLDGWSCAVVISDWVEIYSHLMSGQELPAKPGLLLHEYTRWVGRQDKHATLDYWDRYLPKHIQFMSEAFQESETSTTKASQQGSCQESLSPGEYDDLQQQLRQAGLSLGTLLQAAFATVLHSGNNRHSALFGTTVSGRQIDLPQTDQRVGMLTNVMPVRIDFDSGISIHEWLKSIQARFFSSLPHAHVSMMDVLTLRPTQTALYDCLLVLENQPIVQSTPQLEVSNFHSGIISEFPLTLIAVPGSDLQLFIRYRKDRFKHAVMESLLGQFKKRLLGLPISLSNPVSSLNQYKRINTPSCTDTAARITETADDVSGNIGPDELVKPLLEQKLRDIWSNILKNKNILANDNFFDLGGTSLQAVLLFEQIEKNLGIQLSPTTLFRAPTIADIATLIETDQPDSTWSNIVGINASGAKIPLFIPFEEADMLLYRHLCNELGPDQPVYGLKVPVNALPADELIETLVRHVKTIQPNGPYQLAGLSGSGMLAWRIAQKLQAQGNMVAMLVLLDSYGPAYPRLLPPFRRLNQVSIHLMGKFALIAKRIMNRFTGMLLAPFSSKGHLQQGKRVQSRSYEQQNKAFLQRVFESHAEGTKFLSEVSHYQAPVDRVINRAVLAMTKWRFRSHNLGMAFTVFIQGLLIETGTELQKQPGDSGECETDPLQLLKKLSACLDESMPATRRTLDSYLANYDGLEPYCGNLVFFSATQRPPGVINDSLVGWQYLFPEHVRMYDIAGNHTSIMAQPNVHVLAEYLKKEIAKSTGYSKRNGLPPSKQGESC